MTGEFDRELRKEIKAIQDEIAKEFLEFLFNPQPRDSGLTQVMERQGQRPHEP
jgi:hypothetical protein